MAKKKSAQHARSSCPVACLLDVIGDKWTLLIVRDLFLGKTRYGEFASSSESIPTNVLADRLKRLLAAKIIEKHAYQTNPLRYEYVLTARGRDLEPVIVECVRWGEKHVGGTRAAKSFDRSLLEA